jgi:hypothetical protein
MDLSEEREETTSMPGNIASLTEQNSPKDEKETPQIKETLLEASGTNLESPFPQVSSIPVVNSIIPSYVIPISI